jgi:hypothetical protein
MPTTLEEGETTQVIEVQRVDFCSDEPITNTVAVKADPGGCEFETTIEFQPSRRRI